MTALRPSSRLSAALMQLHFMSQKTFNECTSLICNPALPTGKRWTAISSLCGVYRWPQYSTAVDVYVSESCMQNRVRLRRGVVQVQPSLKKTVANGRHAAQGAALHNVLELYCKSPSVKLFELQPADSYAETRVGEEEFTLSGFRSRCARSPKYFMRDVTSWLK